MIDADCQRRRLRNTHSQLANELAKEFEDAPENTLGCVFRKDCAGNRLLDKVFRRQQAAQRNWFRGFQLLLELNKARVATALAVYSGALSPEPTAEPEQPEPAAAPELHSTQAPGPAPDA